MDFTQNRREAQQRKYGYGFHVGIFGVVIVYLMKNTLCDRSRKQQKMW